MVRGIGIFLLLCVVSLSGRAEVKPNMLRLVDQAQMNHWVDSVFDAMSYDERIGQLFMIKADPGTDSCNIRELMQYVEDIKLGGILFSKGDPMMQADVTNRLQKASHVPMMIALDGEWGLSMRLSGTTRFPRNMMLGAVENDSLIEEYGREVARQCREMGIHVNFAPDMDVNSNVDNPVIGIRSFGEDPEAVAEKGIAYSRGLESGGVISVSKHFPGHGDTSEDSHKTLPVIRHDRARLDSVELLPFRRYIQEGLSGIMVGHLYVPALEKGNTPTSLSKATVKDLLQGTYGFQGLCFTDALSMKGASTKKKDNSSVKALLAGNDILLSPSAPVQDFAAVKEAIEDGTLKLADIEAKCLKILRYKYVSGLNDYAPIDTTNLYERLNSPHAAWLTAELNAEAITLLKNEEEILPLKGLDKKKIALLSIGEEEDNEFQKMLCKYDSIACFSISRTSEADYIKRVYNKLEKYDMIICGVHTARIPESYALRELAKKKELIYAFFTVPYTCSDYEKSIKNAKAVVMAYESTPLAQEYAAQVIFGGIGAKGKLPVSISGLYSKGTGIFTEKTRLGYHEPEEVGLNPNRLDEVTTIAEEGLAKGAYPGCQVLVAKDGMIIYHRAFGYFDYTAEKRPVTEEAVYDLASVSKATGTLLAVMKAYDEKKFTLNSKISEFIPELKGSDKQDLLIKELLYHQSGLTPSINFYMDAIDKGSYEGSLYSSTQTATHPVRFDAKTYVRNDFTFLPELVSDRSKPGFTTEVARHFYVSDSFRDTIIQDIKKSHLGTRGKYVYSCVNFMLLKMMVEKQLGQPMDQLLREDFFKGLGAWHTTYNPLHVMDTLQIVPTEEDGFVRRQLLRGYVHDEAAAFQGGVSGNAGLFSNANDLAKILQLYLNQGVYGGERYLSLETCRLFTQSKSPTCRRGLGFDKPVPGNPKASPCGALAPASVYGHTGYTGTCFWVDPDNDMIYIFLSNRVNPNRMNNKLSALDIRTRIQDAIYKAILVNEVK